MVRLSLAICAFATLATASAGAAETATIILPLALLNKAHEAGSPIEAAEIVDGSRDGIFDRGSGPTLQIGRVAFDAAASQEEKNALLAIALSRRINMTLPTRSDAAKADEALQTVLAAGLDANIASRDRADPYLKQPAPQRRRQAQPDGGAPRGDQTILRGLAWARAAGTCEKVSVNFLTRLAAGEPKNGPVAVDARAALKALGLLRFSPDERC